MNNIKEYVRAANGRFAAYNWKRLERRVIISVMVVSGVVLGGGLLTNNYEFLEKWAVKDTLTYVAPERLYADEIKPDTLEKMREDVLNRLEKCENPHKKPIVFDSNGIASVGQFQWQPHSFQHYWEKKTGQKITEKEAVIKALDDVTARELAAWVIFETDRGSKKDWVICTARNDLTTLVDFIKAHD